MMFCHIIHLLIHLNYFLNLTSCLIWSPYLTKLHGESRNRISIKSIGTWSQKFSGFPKYASRVERIVLLPFMTPLEGHNMSHYYTSSSLLSVIHKVHYKFFCSLIRVCVEFICNYICSYLRF